MYRTLISLLFIFSGISLPLVAYSQDGSACVSKIILDYDSVLYDMRTDSTIKERFIIRNKNNNLLFECHCPDSSDMFSFYLEGNDRKWTSWRNNPVKEYTNLRPGKYSFYVRTSREDFTSDKQLICSFTVEPPFYLTTLAFIIYLAVVVLLFLFFLRLILLRQKFKQARLESVIRERTEELMVEKEKTETLLANLLPKDTADEIMSKGKATKQKYNFATVLFSDIQGFTKIAEEVNPEILIDELDKFFFHFDSVVEKYNIEKIKTIGDAYMCAGGIPHRNRTNPMEVILAALEMQEYMARLKKERSEKGIKFWDIRVGIHTGTVIAGVVGQKKLSYDIWGDTVNTASRMESSCIPGKINISGVTYEYVKDFFICEYRGKMPVKYKGDLDMYFVKGIRPELRKKGRAEPNNLFNRKMLMLKIQDLEDYYFEWYEENVPENFVFHNSKFIKNICTQTELLATAERISDENILGLRLAALFVKAGLLVDYKKPAGHSIDRLEELAPEYGFSKAHIDHARQLIRDIYEVNTESDEAKILFDAINDYYGHVDYPEVTELRFREENDFLGPLNSESWYMEEMEKIREHEFFTETARLLSSRRGKEQAERLAKLIKDIE